MTSEWSPRRGKTRRYTNSGKKVHKLIFIFLCAICFSILQTHKSLLRSPKQISQKNPESTLCIFLPELVLVERVNPTSSVLLRRITAKGSLFLSIYSSTVSQITSFSDPFNQAFFNERIKPSLCSGARNRKFIDHILTSDFILHIE